MVASTQYKIDAFLFPLNAFYADSNKGDIELAKMAENVKALVVAYFNGEHNIDVFVNQHLNNLFEFRMSALKWLIANQVVFDDLNKTFEDELAYFKNDPSLFVLYQNMLFAIRTNIRVVNSLVQPNKKETSGRSIDFSGFSELPKLTYNDYLNVVSLTMPDALLPRYDPTLITPSECIIP